jgi:NAD(P)-dependent dehydrogenase (short-subunit alcohol dehydrogenase family)
VVRPLAEQTILITGATDGLGRRLAELLAAEGATVLVHGRDPARGEAVAADVGGSFYQADLSSLAQVRQLADEVLQRHDRLDVLVNNAGIGGGRLVNQRELSADGYELRFAVNYLAPFLLTRLLAPIVSARIVNVSSAGQAPIDFDDVMLERGYSGIQAYCQSKLALIMLTFDVADELRPSGVTATCLHPGTYMPTKMVLESGIEPVTPLEQGVEATHRLIADPELEGVTAKYFDGVREARPDPQASDLGARRRLRKLSAELVGL